MSRFLVHWCIVTLSLGATTWVLPGVHITSAVALLVAGLVLGLVNATVRPVLTLLTLPVTVLTLGAFYLVVNGAAFALAARIVPGFVVDNFGSAVVGALLVSFVSWMVGYAVAEPSPLLVTPA